MEENDLARLHAVIEGHVQGVGFRYFVQETAILLGLKGWVRNRWDGSVEVTAEGPRPALKHLLLTLYDGPRHATVTDVSSDWQLYTGEFPRFQVKTTAS